MSLDKPDNSAHGRCEIPCNSSECIAFGCAYTRQKLFVDQAGDNIIINPVVEPSESQEEILKSLVRFIDDRQDHGQMQLVNELKEKFTITRK